MDVQSPKFWDWEKRERERERKELFFGHSTLQALINGVNLYMSCSIVTRLNEMSVQRKKMGRLSRFFFGDVVSGRMKPERYKCTGLW